jgi:hypothetical protein
MTFTERLKDIGMVSYVTVCCRVIEVTFDITPVRVISLYRRGFIAIARVYRWQ